MASLEVAQSYATEAAKKLGLEVAPLLVWQSESGCKNYIEAHSHCHPRDAQYGTICIRDSSVALRTPLNVHYRNWQWLIAHEVCHFRISNHSTRSFLELMRQLGQFTETEEWQLQLVEKREKDAKLHKALVRWAKEREAELVAERKEKEGRITMVGRGDL